MRRRTGARTLLAAWLLPGLLVAGCGGDTSSTARVPALDQRLGAVDRAVAAHDDAATRTALTQLEHTVHDARSSGDLDQQHADEILSAARTLLEALPGAHTPAPATSSPSPTTTTTPTKAPPPPPAHEPKDKPPKHDEHKKPDKHDEHGPGHGPKH